MLVNYSIELWSNHMISKPLLKESFVKYNVYGSVGFYLHPTLTFPGFYTSDDAANRHQNIIHITHADILNTVFVLIAIYIKATIFLKGSIFQICLLFIIVYTVTCEVSTYCFFP